MTAITAPAQQLTSETMLPLLMASANLATTGFPDNHERGFSFKVPRSQRHAIERAMIELGKVHGFEVDHVGFFGRIRCTYRERDSIRVLAFLTTAMSAMTVDMIPDYQARYGVWED